MSIDSPWPEKLIAWYQKHARVMPWRSDPLPYKVWISEVMLQQTQVDTVIPYFNRFIKLFPNIRMLADSDLQAVLKAWEGLGYYSRARNLHKAAKFIQEHWGGELPMTYIALITLPGFGPYIAAAVASIAFGEPVPTVDGNVLCVCARLWGDDRDIRDGKTRKVFFDRLKPAIQNVDPALFNQALMELGALICTPRSPSCLLCPIQRACVAVKDGKVTQLPYRSSRPPVPHYNIAVAVIWDGQKVLIGRRKENQMLGGLWEFPGGKQKEQEPLSRTVTREVYEETNLTVKVIDRYPSVKHAYTHFKITLHPFKCKVITGDATPNTTDELRWVDMREIDSFPFPTANKRLIQALRR